MVPATSDLVLDDTAFQRKKAALARMTRGPVKACSCGKTYTLARWFRLTGPGFWKIGTKENELKHCSCRSTMLLTWTTM